MPVRLLELTCTVFLRAICQVPSSEYWCETRSQERNFSSISKHYYDISKNHEQSKRLTVKYTDNIVGMLVE